MSEIYDVYYGKELVRRDEDFSSECHGALVRQRPMWRMRSVHHGASILFRSSFRPNW